MSWRPAFGTFPAGVSSSSTAATLATSPAPTDGEVVYVAEFDATYRWVAGSAATADGFRVITGTAGRWILVGTRITLSPRGGVLDDWARLIGGACASMANYGEVHMAAGAWRCDTKQTTPNGTILVANQGVTVASTLTPNAPGGAEDASPFYNSGGTEGGDTTTLSVAAVAGDVAITVVSAVGVSIGDRLNLREGTTRRCAREVINKVGSVLTLDRPILRAYSIGAGVAVLPTCRDIIIRGGGMLVTGTGDRIVEFISAWDCLVEDVRGDVTMDFFAFGYDVASRDSHFVRCTIDCNATTPAAFALEYAEECTIQDGYSYRPLAYNVVLVGCDNCTVRGGYHTESVAVGLMMSVNPVTDLLGCRGCVIESTAFTKCGTYGMDVQDGSSDNTFVGVETSFCQIGTYFTIGATGSPSARNVIVGGTAKRNTVAAVYCASTGKGNRVVGQSAEDNGSAGNVYVAAAGCELDVHDVFITDATILPSVAGMFLASGAGAIMRLSGFYATSTRATGAQPCVEVQGGAKVFIDGPSTYVGTAAAGIGVYVVAGVARVSGMKVTTAAQGCFLAGATAYARIADDVDFAGATAPFFVAAGAYNRGQVNANGVAAVAIAFGDTNAQDRCFLSLVTAIGIVGTNPAVGAPIVGTGFNLTSVALDVSLYNYEIR